MYINFFENCDNENADANAFWKRTGRKSIFKGSGSVKLADGIVDEFRMLRESKTHQERVRKNVKEVSICTLLISKLTLSLKFLYRY